VKDESNILACGLAIRGGEQIACDHLNSCPLGSALHNAFYPRQVAGGPNKTDEVAKSAIHQVLNNARPNETRSAGYQNSIV
jgi:hypothetical protein